MGKLLTVEEVLAIIPIKEPTLRKYVHEKKIEHVKVGRRVFFKESTIEDLIRRGTVPPKQEARSENAETYT
jgi:excisionase family DNA binding protein